MPDDPPPPPREVVEKLLAEADWVELRAAMVNYALERRCTPAEADDFAHAAYLRVTSGERKWNPNKYPKLVSYMLLVVKSLFLNERKRRKAEVALTDEMVETMPAPRLGALELMILREDEKSGEALLALLLARVRRKGDTLCEWIAVHSQEGVDEVKDQVQGSGQSEEEVLKARKRLRYHLLAIYDQHGATPGNFDAPPPSAPPESQP
jgi:DNA-directed RNA polymerase specialized sigma24 family protein